MGNLIDKQTLMNTLANNNNILSKVTIGGATRSIYDIDAHTEIKELRDIIERLTAKPYFLKIQCHNCGAPLVINSDNHLVKCKYCHTAYFNGTQLINAEV